MVILQVQHERQAMMRNLRKMDYAGMPSTANQLEETVPSQVSDSLSVREEIKQQKPPPPPPPPHQSPLQKGKGAFAPALSL